MTTDVPQSTVLLLMALTVPGGEMIAYDDTNRTVIKLAGYEVTVRESDLFALQQRGLIAWGDDLPDGFPERLEVTNYGRAWLRRHLAANGLPAAFKIVTPSGSNA